MGILSLFGSEFTLSDITNKTHKCALLLSLCVCLCLFLSLSLSHSSSKFYVTLCLLSFFSLFSFSICHSLLHTLSSLSSSLFSFLIYLPISFQQDGGLQSFDRFQYIRQFSLLPTESIERNREKVNVSV